MSFYAAPRPKSDTLWLRRWKKGFLSPTYHCSHPIQRTPCCTPWPMDVLSALIPPTPLYTPRFRLEASPSPAEHLALLPKTPSVYGWCGSVQVSSPPFCSLRGYNTTHRSPSPPLASPKLQRTWSLFSSALARFTSDLPRLLSIRQSRLL